MSRPNRWATRAFRVALVAMAVGAFGSLAGVAVVEDIAAVIALGMLTGGSVMGLATSGARRRKRA